VPPLRYGPVAVPLLEQGQRRPGGGLGNCRTRVFKWGRGTRSFKFHLRHRLLGWNPLNGVGGDSRQCPTRFWRLFGLGALSWW
jgi:choline dehydrogenase-like flavoprotein